jgi:hypothetical protein
MTEFFCLHLLEYLENHSIESEVKVLTDVDLDHTVYSELYSVCFNDYTSVE